MPAADILGFEVLRGEVREDWIDVNDHMNVAYYVLAFDYGIDTLWDRIGITSDHIRRNNSSTFAVDCQVTYQREMKFDAPYIITTQVLAYDEKRIHQFMRMYHAEESYLAATSEWMNLHVDLNERRVAPWPQRVFDRIGLFVAGQGEWPYPDEGGRRIRVSNPVFAVEEYMRDE